MAQAGARLRICEVLGLQIATKNDKKLIPFPASSLGGVLCEKGRPTEAKNAHVLMLFGVCFWIW